MVDPSCSLLDELKPLCVVDAILAKQNLGTRVDMAPVTIALGLVLPQEKIAMRLLKQTVGTGWDR